MGKPYLLCSSSHWKEICHCYPIWESRHDTIRITANSPWKGLHKQLNSGSIVNGFVSISNLTRRNTQTKKIDLLSQPLPPPSHNHDPHLSKGTRWMQLSHNSEQLWQRMLLDSDETLAAFLRQADSNCNVTATAKVGSPSRTGTFASAHFTESRHTCAANN